MPMKWSAEAMQYVLFFPPQEMVDAYQAWLQVFGTSPDSYQKGPDGQQSIAQGTYAGYPFQLQCQHGRIDLAIVGGDLSSPFPNIVNVDNAIDMLKQKAGVVNSMKPALRLALVVQLFKNFDSQAKTTAEFQKETKLSGIPGEATDLQFAINIRKEFKEAKVTLNRLCRWTALVKQAMQVQIGIMVQGQQSAFEQPALSLVLDVNTVVRPLPFTAASVPGVVDTLFAEFFKLEEQGYARLVD